MPGPANYTLPPTIGCINADITKRKFPCYSIGNRQKTEWKTFGPGPAIYHPGKCTRFGVDKRSPHVGIRLNTITGVATPAPNAYDLPEIIGEKRVPNAYQRRVPAYEFGIRTKQLATQEIPAPNIYDIESTIGSKHETVGYRKAPSYTMGNLVKPFKPFTTPSPAEYFPVVTNPHKIHPSIKARIKDLRSYRTPAPNTYNLQPFKPGARSPAFTIRKKIE